MNSRVPFACLFRQPCRNVCTRINKRMERKTAVYQGTRRCPRVGVRNAGHTVRCGAINTSVTPITQRVDRDVLSRENRNYPLPPRPPLSCALCPTLPSPIAPKFRIISATVALPSLSSVSPVSQGLLAHAHSVPLFVGICSPCSRYSCAVNLY